MQKYRLVRSAEQVFHEWLVHMMNCKLTFLPRWEATSVYVCTSAILAKTRLVYDHTTHSIVIENPVSGCRYMFEVIEEILKELPLPREIIALIGEYCWCVDVLDIIKRKVSTSYASQLILSNLMSMSRMIDS